MVALLEMAEDMQVSRERCWIARYVHYPGNCMSRERIQHHLLAAGAGWINDQPIDLRGQRRQHILHFSLDDLDVARCAQIPPGILDGAGRLLDSNYPLDMPRQYQSKGTHPTICIYDYTRRSQTLHHYLYHLLGLGCVGLEKRARAYAKYFSSKLLFQRLNSQIKPACRQLFQNFCSRVRLNEHLTGGAATAYQYLWPLIRLLAENLQREVDLLAGDRARCQWQHAVRSPGGQANFSAAVYREAHVVAVMPWIVTRHCFKQRRLLKPPRLAQQLLHYGALPGKLGRVLHMLQLATAADAKDRAAGLSAQRRSLVYLIDPHAGRV